MSYINYTIRSNGSRISNRHLFGKTISFVMREVMWNRVGIRLVAGKCSLGRQVLRAIRALSRLFTWELKSQTAVWDAAAESLFSESRGKNGGSRRCWKQLISHHWETLHNEPRSFQAKPQQNTHIYSSEQLRGEPEADSFIDSSSVSDFTKWLLNASVNDSLSRFQQERTENNYFLRSCRIWQSGWMDG